MFENNKKKIPYTGILISFALIVYACIRFYGYFVPEKDVTIYFKSDSCDIVEAVRESKFEDCALHGDLRVDLTGGGFFLKLKSGDEIYFRKDVMKSLKFSTREKE